MSDFRDRFMRLVRSNLNELLDDIREFEDRGGWESFVDDVLEGRARERLRSEEEEGDQQRPNYEPPRSADEKTIRDYYANLEVSYGADLQTVKKNYRRLMRKYHPDRFNDDPEMQELATELSQELSQAYAKVKKHIEQNKNRR